MELVHPLYPFLTLDIFMKRAFSADLARDLATDKSWAALYYAIAALGCQCNDGGSFEPGVGEAWSYFERSASYFQDIVFSKASLTSVQVCARDYKIKVHFSSTKLIIVIFPRH